jgi:hypothetical protein
MAIEMLVPLARNQVIWVASAVPRAIRMALSAMGYQLRLEEATALADLKTELVAAVVFIQEEEKPLRAIEQMGTKLPRLLDEDCLVFIWRSNSGVVAIQNFVKSLPHVAQDMGPEIPFPHAYLIRPAAKPREIAQVLLTRIARFASKINPATKLLILPDGLKLDATDKRLLRRAFSDCEQIHLQRFTDGNSSSRVFLAHATHSGQTVSSQPQPYFVKIGARATTFQEWTNYVEAVHRTLPFHLAPRLALARCGLGASKGIIVGDFVEDSESLSECSRGARAATPVGTLFERTLRGWRSRASAPPRANLARSLRSLVAGTVPNNRVLRANGVGAIKNPALLKQQLAVTVTKRSSEPFLWGQIHGDMHTNNVRVRGSDSVLIDFLATKSGLTLLDPAMLEVSLLIRAPLDEKFDEKTWFEIALSLYSREALSTVPDIPDPTGRYAWIANCIRQVRLHALQMEKSKGQYALVLAHYLFFAATKDAGAGPSEDFRRAAAYAIAEKVANIAW